MLYRTRLHEKVLYAFKRTCNENRLSYIKQRGCHICKKRFKLNDSDTVKDHCHYKGKYRGAIHSACNLHYKELKESPIVFHNGSTYDHHFIIKELPKEFNGEFKYLGENTEKYITFSVALKKMQVKMY